MFLHGSTVRCNSCEAKTCDYPKRSQSEALDVSCWSFGMKLLYLIIPISINKAL